MEQRICNKGESINFISDVGDFATPFDLKLDIILSKLLKILLN